MYYVYVLYNYEKELMYVGYTNDLKRRYKEHINGQSKYTKDKEWILVYYEAYLSKIDAINRENKLKQRGQSKRFLKERIKNSLNPVKD